MMMTLAKMPPRSLGSHRPRPGGTWRGSGVALLLFAVASGCSCSGEGIDAATSSSEGSGGVGGGAPVSVVVTTGATAPTGSSSSAATTTTGGGAGGHSGACAAWPGWEDYDDVFPEAGYCVPSSPAHLPEPITWEPCPADFGFTQGCRQMAHPWAPNFGRPFANVASVDASGTDVVLQVQRVAETASPAYVELVTGHADGPLLTSLRSTLANFEKMAWGIPKSRGIHEGHTLLSVFDTEEVSAFNFREALVGGPVSQLRPDVLVSWESSGGKAIAVSSTLWGWRSPATVAIGRWGEPAVEITGTGPTSGLYFWNSFATWETGDSLVGGHVLAYDASLPSPTHYPLITSPGPLDLVAGFGTDGVHMAWLRGHGKTEPYAPYPHLDLMTAPFSKNPAALAATAQKRLSIPTDAVPVTHTAVGCGHVAYGYEGRHVLLVRLSDGAWWEFPSQHCVSPAQTASCFGNPLAITCSEVFIDTTDSGHGNVARVELSALGPPNPPQPP